MLPQVLEPKQSSGTSTCFGSPAVGYCNSNSSSSSSWNGKAQGQGQGQGWSQGQGWKANN